MPTIDFLIVVPLLFVLGIATAVDWRHHRIPNVLTFGGAVFAFITHTTLDGASGLLFSALGWLACLAFFLPFYLLRGMSAGDVKLIATVGAFLGPGVGLFASFCALITGGVLAVVCVLWWRRHNDKLKCDELSRETQSSFGIRFPYAGAIACGASFVIIAPSKVPTVLAELGSLT